MGEPQEERRPGVLGVDGVRRRQLLQRGFPLLGGGVERLEERPLGGGRHRVALPGGDGRSRGSDPGTGGRGGRSSREGCESGEPGHEPLEVAYHPVGLRLLEHDL